MRDIEEIEQSAAITTTAISHPCCIKCEEPGVLSGLDAKSIYCEACYLRMVRHKFRSTLGKRRVFKDGAPQEVLMVFDGSAASALQLELLHEASSEGPHSRLPVIPTVLVFVASGASPEDIQASSQALKTRVLSSHRWVYVHEAASLLSNLTIPEGEVECLGLGQCERWSSFLSSITSSTAAEELRRLLAEGLFRRIADVLSLPRLMLPLTADALAKHALSALCLGRGGSVSDSTSVLDKRRQRVATVRAMREISDVEVKEVMRLLDLTALLPSSLSSFPTSAAPRSIHDANNLFVDTLLGDGFRGTISTVLSTASKIHSKRGGTNRCCLCLTEGAEPGETPICDPCSALADEVADKETLNELLERLVL